MGTLREAAPTFCGYYQSIKCNYHIICVPDGDVTIGWTLFDLRHAKPFYEARSTGLDIFSICQSDINKFRAGFQIYRNHALQLCKPIKAYQPPTQDSGDNNVVPQVGDTVMAKRNDNERWYDATIEAVNNDGT